MDGAATKCTCGVSKFSFALKCIIKEMAFCFLQCFGAVQLRSPAGSKQLTNSRVSQRKKENTPLVKVYLTTVKLQAGARLG